MATLADLFASTQAPNVVELPRQAVPTVQPRGQKLWGTVGRIADMMAALGGEEPAYRARMERDAANTRKQAQQNYLATIFQNPTNEFAAQDYLRSGGDLKTLAAVQEMNAPVQPKTPEPLQVEREFNFISERLGPERAQQYIQQKFKMTPEQVQAATVGGVRGVDVRDEAGNVVGFRPTFDARRAPAAASGGGGPKPPKAPSGYRYTAEGSLEPIPGGPKDKGSAATAPGEVLSLIQQARALLPKATAGGLSGMATSTAEFLNMDTARSRADAALNVIAGRLTATSPRFEGPQGVLDVKLYQQMAADVANRALPVQSRLAALAEMEKIVQRNAARRPAAAPAATGGFKVLRSRPAQ